MATWTEADIAALKASIGRGVQRVDFADRSITYPSLESMLALLAQMEASLAVETGDRPSYRVAAHSKGV